MKAAERIKGLKAAGASEREIGAATQALLKEQHADGGWSQTPYLDSDAYATGMVLAALYQEGLLKPSDAVYARGTAFLMKTSVPGRVVVRPQPVAEAAAVLPERVPVRPRPVDLGVGHGAGSDGSGSGDVK